MVTCSYIVEYRGFMHIIRVSGNIISDRYRGVEYGIIIGDPEGDKAYIKTMDIELRIANDVLIDLLLDTFSHVLKRGKLVEVRCDER